MLGRDVIVIGGSTGAVAALRELLPRLPQDLGAAIFIVIHIGGHATDSQLRGLLPVDSKLPVSWARDHEKVELGHIYIAPPDQHLMLRDGHMRVIHGPKENHTRPAIDPLFRSAAIAYGARVVGVLLSGYLDDGTAGLLAIKDRGGVAIVQDPVEAVAPEMPRSALASVPIDHCVSIRKMAETLVQYDPPQQRVEVAIPPLLEIEHKLTAMQVLLADRSELERVAVPSPYSCPECDGTLYQLKDQRLQRFRCSQAHAWSALSLLSALADARETAICGAARTLAEEAELARNVAERTPTSAEATGMQARAASLARHVQELHALLAANVPSSHGKQ